MLRVTLVCQVPDLLHLCMRIVLCQLLLVYVIEGYLWVFFRYAVLLQMPESYCVNTGHMLGEFAMRKRHLKLLKYQVIEVSLRESTWSHLTAHDLGHVV